MKSVKKDYIHCKDSATQSVNLLGSLIRDYKYEVYLSSLETLFDYVETIILRLTDSGNEHTLSRYKS